MVAQGVRDSIIYYIDNELIINNKIYDTKILQFTEALFSELNTEEIGVFYGEIEGELDSVKNILARTYLKEVNCAFLSNSSQYKEAENCCLDVVAFGIEHNRSDIEAYGLHDLSYVYNHLGRYTDQIDLLSRVIEIWKERDGSSEYLRYAVQQKGEGYAYLGKFDSSFFYMEQALELEKQFGNNLSLCNVYEKYSRIYLEEGDYENSFQFGKKGLEIARTIKSKVRIQTNLMYVGFSAFYLGRYNQAIDHELEALALYEGFRNSSTASVYIRLGRIYNSIEDYGQAEKYLKEAISILEEVDYEVGLAKARTELAFTLINMERFELAFQSLEYSKEVFERLDDKIYLSLTQRRIAQFYSAQGLCDLGIDMQNQAIEILEEVDKKGSLATSYLEKANILKNCNRAIDAVNSALEGLQLQKETGDIKSQSEGHLFLYNFYKEEGNENSALYHFEEYVKYYKLLTQSAEQQSIAEERARFNVEQIEKSNEIVIARNEVLQSRNVLFAVIVSGLIFLGSLGMFYFFKLRKLNRKIEGQNLKIEGQNKELVNLNKTKDRFFGIIAHDLRNPLIAFQGIGKQIRHYTKNKQVEKLTDLSKEIETLSGRLNALLDNLLNWSLIQTGQIPYKPQVLNLMDEIDEVYDLVEPMSIAKGIILMIDIDEEAMVYVDSRALQTILRNLVTNSLKYTDTEGRIKISSFKEDNLTRISIIDNGIGMSAHQLSELRDNAKESREGTEGEKGTGLGLVLAFDLIAMNRGEMKIDSVVGEGTQVIITLPNSEIK